MIPIYVSTLQDEHFLIHVHRLTYPDFLRQYVLRYYPYTILKIWTKHRQSQQNMSFTVCLHDKEDAKVRGFMHNARQYVSSVFENGVNLQEFMCNHFINDMDLSMTVMHLVNQLNQNQVEIITTPILKKSLVIDGLCQGVLKEFSFLSTRTNRTLEVDKDLNLLLDTTFDCLDGLMYCNVCQSPLDSNVMDCQVEPTQEDSGPVFTEQSTETNFSVPEELETESADEDADEDKNFNTRREEIEDPTFDPNEYESVSEVSNTSYTSAVSDCSLLE